jgi:hypothetical protein
MCPEDGFHSYSYPDGSNYEGFWKSGKPHGHGIHKFLSGGQYSGEFRNGVRHGQGIYIYPGGDIYSGSFFAGYREGDGEYTYAQGSSYVGEWVCDKMHGFGKAKDSAGKVLIGMWIHGHAHGKCQIVDGNHVQSACYKSGTLVSKGEPKLRTQDNNKPLYDGLNWLTNAVICNLGCEAFGCGTRSSDAPARAIDRPSHLVSWSGLPARGN